jgi:hypothetical protein
MLGRKPQDFVKGRTAKTALSLLLAVFASVGLGVLAAHAQTDQFGLAYGEATGLTNVDIRVTIAKIIRIVLGLLGTVALLIVLYGGFTWMTAAGEADKVDKAKKILTSGVIGLVIIVSAFAIVSFVISRLLDASQEGPGGDGGGGLDDVRCIGLSATCPAGALGNGIIENHYPVRGATGVPRNTRIFITFKEKINPASLVVGGATATVAIIKSNGVATSNQFPAKFAQSLTAADIDVVSTADGKTFGFMQKNCSSVTPENCIGSPAEKVFYTVALRGGSDGVKKLNGNAAFVGTFGAGYAWEFQVSTELDLTPPKVTISIPDDGSEDNPRNSLIQVNFDEPADPISVSQGMTVTRSGGAIIPGVKEIGNGYRSVEFRTEDACGVNSCGETIYCLPGNASIEVDVKADGLTANPPTGVFPPNGITDMAGNSLDGDKDGVAKGPPTDDYEFGFSTNNTIDLVPPRIVAQEPALTIGGTTGDVPRDLRITATFSKLMSTTSFRSDTARLVPGDGGAPTNYYVISEHVSTVVDTPPTRTKGIIAHDLMSLNQPYSTDFNSSLRDTRQNCFFPARGETTCTGSEPFCCNGLPSGVDCAFLQ